MSQVISFGTDGWRGIIAEDFTFPNVRLCAQSVADYLKANNLDRSGLVVGFDTRFASERFAEAVAEVITGNDIPVFLCRDAAPTPVISYSITSHRTAGAIIITASHNPAAWNGLKFKPQYGGSAPTEVTNALEEGIRRIGPQGEIQRLPLVEGRRKGLVQEIDPSSNYLVHLGQLVDLERIRGFGTKVVVDSMFGSGRGYFAKLLRGGDTKVDEIHAGPNPLFPGLERPEPIGVNLAALGRSVSRRRASIGIATDGDADRLGAVDETGSPLTPLQLFALLTLYCLEVRGEIGPLVKSITSTSMIYRLGELFSVPVYETPVGFKFLGPKMLEVDALIAGEESGGFGFRGHIPERDGILSGLYLLDMMAAFRKTPREMINHLYGLVGPHYYDRRDYTFSPGRRQEIVERVEDAKPDNLGGLAVLSKDETDGSRFLLEGGAWMQIRFSGTEPLLRMYSEAGSPEQVERLLYEGARLIGILD